MRLKVPAFARLDAEFPGGWALYKLQEDGRQSFLWQQFKVMLPEATPARRGQRRAYLITWGVLEQRWRRDRDTLAFERSEPDLAAQVELHLSLGYDRKWLLDPDGACVTEAEVAAEILRLRALSAKRRAQRLAA